MSPEREVAEWKEKCLRAKAELVNYQRRAEKDRAEGLKYANASFIRALLPVIDDLERVMASGAAHPENAQAILDGGRLTLENFLKILRDFRVEVIKADGEPFDPEVHEAMMEQPSPDHPTRTVLQEVAKGYRLFDRVLRPAKVIVSKAVESAVDETEEAGAGQEAASGN